MSNAEPRDRASGARPSWKRVAARHEKPVTLWSRRRSLSFRLWDDLRKQLVGFGRIRAVREARVPDEPEARCPHCGTQVLSDDYACPDCRRVIPWKEDPPVTKPRGSPATSQSCPQSQVLATES